MITRSVLYRDKLSWIYYPQFTLSFLRNVPISCPNRQTVEIRFAHPYML